MNTAFLAMLAEVRRGTQQDSTAGGGGGGGGGGGDLGAHPRIWMDDTALTRLRLQVANNTTRWQNLKASADLAVSAGAYSAGEEIRLSDVALAYLAVVDTNPSLAATYATAAGVLLDGFCTTARLTAMRSDSGYPYRSDYPNVACGLDWAYDGLTQPQRENAATWLMDAADWVWGESNSSRVAGYGVNDPANNYFAGFCYTGLGAIAASGDDTSTVGYIEAYAGDDDRPLFHRNLVASKFTDDFVPVLEEAHPTGDPMNGPSGALGGQFAEGTAYGMASAWYMARIVDGYRTAGTPLAVQGFWADAVVAMMNITMPGFTYMVPIGDQARDSSAALYQYQRLAIQRYATIMAADADLAAQAHYWIGQVGQVPAGTGSTSQTLVEETILYDPAASAATDLSALPLGFYADGAGLVVWRSSWTDPNALAIAFDAVAAEAHRVGAGNSLMIWKGGEWLSCNANIYSSSGINVQTSQFNSMTAGADALGQAYQRLRVPGNGSEIIGTPSFASNLVYMRGQAKTAYGFEYDVDYAGVRIRTVTNFLRTIAVLPTKNTIIVVDQVTVVDAGVAKTFYWHCLNTPTRSGQTFKLSNPSGTYHAYGQVHLPASGLTTAVADYNLNDNVPATVTSKAVTVTGPTGTAAELFVTTMQISSAGAAPYTASASSDGTNVTVVVDDLTVTIPLNGTSAVTVA